MITGSLGSLVFECSSNNLVLLQSFSVSNEARYEEHQAQGTFPRPEFLGPGLPTHNLSILLRRPFLGHSPLEEVLKAQRMMLDGVVARLVIGRIGYGRVTIRKLDYTWNGVLRSVTGPLSIDMNLELKEYV